MIFIFINIIHFISIIIPRTDVIEELSLDSNKIYIDITIRSFALAMSMFVIFDKHDLKRASG